VEKDLCSVLRARRRSPLCSSCGKPNPAAASLESLPVAGVVDQDAARGLGCGGNRSLAQLRQFLPAERLLSIFGSILFSARSIASA
jgi:hypothetical protein